MTFFYSWYCIFIINFYAPSLQKKQMSLTFFVIVVMQISQQVNTNIQQTEYPPRQASSPYGNI